MEKFEVLIVTIEEKRGEDADTKGERNSRDVVCITGSSWARGDDADRSSSTRLEDPTFVGGMETRPEGRDLERTDRSLVRYGGLGEYEIIDSRRRPQAIARVTVSGKACDRVGCTRPHHAKGLCKACYCAEARRLKKLPGALVTRPRCVVDGCHREQHAKEFCKQHYEGMRRQVNNTLRATGRRRYWLRDLI